MQLKVEYSNGSIFDSDCDALVNPVNCVGVMGKGLALEFKRQFPRNFACYKECCAGGWFSPGMSATFQDGGKFIINLATKNHWRDPSKIEWIETGIRSILCAVRNSDGEIASMAIPALGCGCGGLDWRNVEAAILQELRGCGVPDFVRDRIGDLRVVLYPPKEG